MSEADVRAALKADADLDRARTRLEAGAVTVAAAYLPGVSDRVTIAGDPLEPGATVACAGPTTLDLPGLGRLTLRPGGDAAAAAREAAAAEAALRAILAPSGAQDVAALAAIAERRGAAEARAATARAELAGLAPRGTAPLEVEIAQARRDAVGADPDGADPVAAAEAETAARAGLEAAEHARAAAHEARLAAMHADAAAEDKLDAAERELATASDEAAALPARAGLAERLDGRREAVAVADRRAEDLGRAMPDAAAAATALAQAKAAQHEAEERRHRLETRAADLDARIATRADEGVEERRDEIADRLAEAEVRAVGYAAEARALIRLLAALSGARTAARERYLAPVTDELAPLLAMVLDGAEVRMHPTRLMPEALARDGVEEDLAGLSGGTREQIAILTRLAFARLLARSVRATPVILDDALVFADDDRFERLFAAISELSAEVQIIVLTCRERRFARLPAIRPRLLLAASASPLSLGAAQNP